MKLHFVESNDGLVLAVAKTLAQVKLLAKSMADVRLTEVELTSGQEVMVADGFPVELIRSAEQRAAWWRANPPKSGHLERVRDPAQEAIVKQIEDEIKARKKLIKENRDHKKSLRKFDTTGLRWDSQSAKWKPDIGYRYQSQETDMENGKRIRLVAYAADGKNLERGSTSVKTPEEVEGKIAHCFERGGKKVVSVSATGFGGVEMGAWGKDENGNIVRNDGLYREPPSPVQVTYTPKLGPNGRIGERASEAAPEGNSDAATTNEDNMAKKAKKAKANKTGPKGPGVIATIVDTISRDRGASIEEIVEVLVKKFPDRKENSMRSTAKIQAVKNCTSKAKDDKRGLVYYKKR